MKKIVFSDVDGTLLNSGHKITPLTLQSIEKLHAKGIPFVIISARSPSGIYPILRTYGFKVPVIAYSGALILDEDKNVLYHKGMEKPAARKIIEFIEENHFDMTWSVYSLDEWIVKDKSDPRIIEEERIVKAQSVQGSVDTAADARISKILCICNPAEILEIEEKLKDAFPEHSIVKSADFLLEIMEKDVTKAAAVRLLCSRWGISLSAAVAFGDNYNDAEMLETVGNGFLMANAPADLKRRIRLHTRDNNQDGIFHALSKLNLV